MSLIRNFNSARDLTIEQRQALTKQAMQRSINALFKQMIAVYKENVRMTFDNPYNLSKDQVIAGFGNDAVELIRLGTLLRDVINLAAPGTIESPADEYNGGNV